MTTSSHNCMRTSSYQQSRGEERRTPAAPMQDLTDLMSYAEMTMNKMSE